MEKRDFKGVWIPKEIWLNKDLTPLEKIYLVEIDSLDDGEFGCYASNKHFENMFGQVGPNISRTIKKLEEKGWIKISYEFKGKEVEKRIIKVQRPPYPDRYYQNDNRCYQNDNGVLSNLSEGYYQNDKDRITILDKQLDNNISTTTIYDCVEQNFGRTLSPMEYEDISKWEDSALTRYAIKKAVTKNICSVSYISGILGSYERNNIKTVQQAQLNDKQFKERQEQNRKYKGLSFKEREYLKQQELMDKWVKGEN